MSNSPKKAVHNEVSKEIIWKEGWYTLATLVVVGVVGFAIGVAELYWR